MVTSQTMAERWVAITGASSGIGEAAAMAFAARGYSVALIARRRLIDRSRKSSRRPQLSSIPEGLESPTDDHERLERSIEASQILEEVQRLPDKQREFIELSLIIGLSHSQIAERTDTPLGTVKSNIRRGLAEVKRRVLTPMGDRPAEAL